MDFHFFLVMEKSRKINIEKEGHPVCVRGVVARAFHGAALLPPRCCLSRLSVDVRARAL